MIGLFQRSSGLSSRRSVHLRVDTRYGRRSPVIVEREDAPIAVCGCLTAVEALLPFLRYRLRCAVVVSETAAEDYDATRQVLDALDLLLVRLYGGLSLCSESPFTVFTSVHYAILRQCGYPQVESFLVSHDGVLQDVMNCDAGLTGFAMATTGLVGCSRQ